VPYDDEALFVGCSAFSRTDQEQILYKIATFVKSILFVMRLQPFTIIALSFILLAFSSKGQSAQENKKIITRYLLEIFNGRKLELLGEVFPERFVRHDLNDSTDTWMTVADQQKRLSDLFHAFPDFYYTISDIIAEGDKVVVRAVWHGTQKNTFMKTESAGNRIDSVSEIIFYRLEKGKIVERWTQLDLYNLLKKMKGEK
jgi:predicted ester cyclase